MAERPGHDGQMVRRQEQIGRELRTCRLSRVNHQSGYHGRTIRERLTNHPGAVDEWSGSGGRHAVMRRPGARQWWHGRPTARASRVASVADTPGGTVFVAMERGHTHPASVVRTPDCAGNVVRTARTEAPVRMASPASGAGTSTGQTSHSHPGRWVRSHCGSGRLERHHR